MKLVEISLFRKRSLPTALAVSRQLVQSWPGSLETKTYSNIKATKQSTLFKCGLSLMRLMSLSHVNAQRNFGFVKYRPGKWLILFANARYQSKKKEPPKVESVSNYLMINCFPMDNSTRWFWNGFNKSCLKLLESFTRKVRMSFGFLPSSFESRNLKSTNLIG